MARPSKLQCYVTSNLRDRAHAVARESGVSVSEWLRLTVLRACDASAAAVNESGRTARQSVFVMVGVDALLAGHPDHELRERAHQAFARKCRQLGIPLSNEEGV
jgi:hypothetical protein